MLLLIDEGIFQSFSNEKDKNIITKPGMKAHCTFNGPAKFIGKMLQNIENIAIYLNLATVN